MLRNEIIPNFYKINSSFKNNINNTLKYFENVKDYIDLEVKNFLKENENYFCTKNFNNISDFLQKEIIRYIYFIRN
jgi:c-di-GMP-binding flagellar brake protein YcgR